MRMKTRLSFLSVVCGVVLGCVGLAVAGNLKAVQPVKTAPAQGANKGQLAQDKAACRELNEKEKELLEQQKQLERQAQEKFTEDKELIRQANALEKERVGEERSERKGQNNESTNAELKGQEQQRVNLERQAQEKANERKELVRQAEEVAKQRKEVVQQHNEQCEFGKGAHEHEPAK